MPDTPDVIVIGAGVVGLTSAICLVESGMRVHVLAAAPPQDTTSRAASAMARAWRGLGLRARRPGSRRARVSPQTL